MPHNIVSAIPLTDQTNPNKFPSYEFHEFPKMMLRKVNAQDVKDWEEANIRKDENGRVSYPMGRPRAGGLTAFLNPDGQPVMVHDPEEEEAFRVEHPETEQIQSMGSQSEMAERLAELEAENATLRAKVQGGDGGARKDEEDEPNETKVRSIAGLAPKPAPAANKPKPKKTGPALPAKLK